MADDPTKFEVHRIDRAESQWQQKPGIATDKLVAGFVALLALVGICRLGGGGRGNTVVRSSSPRFIEAQTGTWSLCSAISEHTRTWYAMGFHGADLLPASTPQLPLTPPGRDAVTVPPSAWDEPSWRALAFEIRGPHHFSYAWTRNGDTGVIRAVGDPDGDGVLSIAERTVTLKANGDAQCGDQSMRGDPL